jgi:hypothetical protein
MWWRIAAGSREDRRSQIKLPQMDWEMPLQGVL